MLQLKGTYWDEEGNFYIMTEKLKTSLADIIEDLKKKERVFSPKMIKKIMFQLIQACVDLMNANIYHCDIKPENIMFDKYYNLKLIDFGMAERANTNQFSQDAQK